MNKMHLVNNYKYCLLTVASQYRNQVIFHIEKYTLCSD